MKKALKSIAHELFQCIKILLRDLFCVAVIGVWLYAWIRFAFDTAYSIGGMTAGVFWATVVFFLHVIFFIVAFMSNNK